MSYWWRWGVIRMSWKRAVHQGVRSYNDSSFKDMNIGLARVVHRVPVEEPYQPNIQKCRNHGSQIFKGEAPIQTNRGRWEGSQLYKTCTLPSVLSWIKLEMNIFIHIFWTSDTSNRQTLKRQFWCICIKWGWVGSTWNQMVKLLRRKSYHLISKFTNGSINCSGKWNKSQIAIIN